MARPYKALRDLMRKYDLTNELLGQEIGCAASTVSNKLNAHYPWTSDEMWKIMDITNQPMHRLHEIFPPNGRNETAVNRKVIRRPA